MTPTALEVWARRIADAGRLSPGSTLLDVGGGSGVLSGAIHAVCGARCVVADPLPPDNSPFEVSFVPTCAESLPFATATYDAVLFSHTLHHVTNPLAALVEAARVSKPSARLLIRTASHADLRSVAYARWMPTRLDAILCSVPDVAVLRDWVAEAGWFVAAETRIQTPSEITVAAFAESVADAAFSEWALTGANTPDPSPAAQSWARTSFQSAPPVSETFLTASRTLR